MASPTIPELLRFAFDTNREMTIEDFIDLDWPVDIDGQARCIQHLSDIAQSPAPYEIRSWAFDKLREIARDYREEGVPDSVPLEMFSWCFGVVSGAIERPKRQGGPPGQEERLMARNRLVVATVAWLVGRGENRTNAVRMVSDAASLSESRVDSIIQNSGIPFDKAKAKYSPARLMQRSLKNPTGF